MNDDETIFFTARHLLAALQALDGSLLDLPVVLVHGKVLDKPNLVAGFIPAPVEVGRDIVAAKKPSLLALAAVLDPPASKNGHTLKTKKFKAKGKQTKTRK